MFETEADYRARVSKLIDLVRSLQAELKAKEQKIRDKLMAEPAVQKTPLIEQTREISGQEFTLGPADVKFKLQKYMLETDKFLVHVEPKKALRKSFLFLAFLPVPKSRAKGYWYHPDLLVPKVTWGQKAQA